MSIKKELETGIYPRVEKIEASTCAMMYEVCHALSASNIVSFVIIIIHCQEAHVEQ